MESVIFFFKKNPPSLSMFEKREERSTGVRNWRFGKTFKGRVWGDVLREIALHVMMTADNKRFVAERGGLRNSTVNEILKFV